MKINKSLLSQIKVVIALIKRRKDAQGPYRYIKEKTRHRKGRLLEALELIIFLFLVAINSSLSTFRLAPKSYRKTRDVIILPSWDLYDEMVS